MAGLHTISVCDIRHPKATKIIAEIENLIKTCKNHNQIFWELKFLYRQLCDLTLVKQKVVHNIIPTVGRSVIAQRFANTTTYTGVVNYGAVGSSNTAPVNGDTTLTTETFRKAISSAAYASNIAYLSNFYSASDFTGTVEEAGWFIDGTSSVDTGQILSHFLTTTIAKAATETLTCESEITIS